MQSRKVVLRTSLIQILEIDANPNSALFLGDKNNIRYPFSQWYMINNISFQKLFNLGFYCRSFPRMDLTDFFLDLSHHGVSLDLMYNYGWINPRHFFIHPRKKISEFFEQSSILFSFFCLTVLSDMNMFNSSKLH